MSEIDPKEFRAVLGHFPTGVTVVTAVDGEDPVGLAVGSFSSVSLDPPLVLFCVDKGSSSWPRIEQSGAFCVNVLAEDQKDLCSQFATPGDKYAGVSWEPTELGSPRLPDVLAWIDCRLDQVVEGGDHWIAIGAVEALAVARDDVGPLLFFQGKYGAYFGHLMTIYALGDREPEIHEDAYIHPDAVVIGKVRVGSEATVWPGAVLRGDDGFIDVGARTSVQDGTVVHATMFHDTVIGHDCVIGHMVHLEGCRIEPFSLVGNGSVVLHEAVVHSHSLVGSNAVVPNRFVVPTGAMALGVPARIRPDKVSEHQFDAMVEVYVQRGRQYREQLRVVG